ncbi:DUF3460 family protein [Propionivibrio dicarboxylicus]|uniref:DUF3460 domain-containing protein n=1 Tax=Propionivibrio dicarboxylicus TaxID=83767 RepID=A0A1G8C4Z3_9RHOO|nr:DUF3460 family protein [Propionivibrio dicarboxylicus]SDH40369.1 Protein of unknown function [Propionivibrio dicarboxylicus]
MAAPYESEFTLFLRDMKSRHPEWSEQQRAGRALLWEKNVDFDELRRFAEASVPPSPCRYDIRRT